MPPKRTTPRSSSSATGTKIKTTKRTHKSRISAPTVMTHKRSLDDVPEEDTDDYNNRKKVFIDVYNEEEKEEEDDEQEGVSFETELDEEEEEEEEHVEDNQSSSQGIDQLMVDALSARLKKRRESLKKERESTSNRPNKLEKIFEKVDEELEELRNGPFGVDARRKMIFEKLEQLQQDSKTNKEYRKRYWKLVKTPNSHVKEFDRVIMEYINGPLGEHTLALKSTIGMLEQRPAKIEENHNQLMKEQKRVIKRGEEVLTNQLDPSQIVKYLRKALYATIPPMYINDNDDE